MSPRGTHRIAVTGLGVVTPHARDVEGTWEAILAGRRAARRLEPIEPGTIAPRSASSPGWSGAPARGMTHGKGLDEPIIELARRATNEALAQARLKLSLGPFTLAHALARLVMAEQLYRASTILTGHPYHTGH